MNANSRWSFVYEGLKQAGLLFGVCLLLVGIGWLILISNLAGDGPAKLLFVFPTVCGISVLIGPVPTLLTCFDISDQQLLWLSCLFIIPYWAGLGTIAGLAHRPDPGSDTNQNPVPAQKLPGKRIRWTVGIIAVVIAVVIAALFFLNGPVIGRMSPNRVKAFRYATLNNLRQIEYARSQFVEENNISTNRLVTEADLTPYMMLNSEGKISRVGPMHYVLNPIDKPVSAVLDSDWRIPRHGWSEGFTFTNKTVFQLPR